MKEKIICGQCNKEIILKDKKLINGFQLVYDTGNDIGDDKKISVFRCKECYKKDKSLTDYQKCQVYSRVVGYLSPVNQWNKGKQQEYKERKIFKIK